MKSRLFCTLFMLSIAISIFAQSPYISRVFEFMPAPGQFVNNMPYYDMGDTRQVMARKAEECLADDARVVVSLGSYGGYVVFGFDHAVENRPGQMDFEILGNAFYSNANVSNNKQGGSCEAGIVMVSHDDNDNGLPDDEWYELAGSDYHNPGTIKQYRITYYRPAKDKQPTPDPSNPAISDTSYIAWLDNQGQQGYVQRNAYNSQSYWPEWVDADSLCFQGTLLPKNAVDESGLGTYYVLYAFDWGYADNHPNTDARSSFNIEWAVDGDGKSVNLPAIHFVKVYTALNQTCGWLGETSTEVMGANDLHLLNRQIDDTTPVQHPTMSQGSFRGDETRYTMLNGVRVNSPTASGIYIEHSPNGLRKLIVR